MPVLRVPLGLMGVMFCRPMMPVSCSIEIEGAD
jgi:hypothetical protein